MRREPYGLIRTLHAWLGVTLGLLLLLSSVTGTLLIWKNELVQLRLADASAPFEPTPEALARIAAEVEAQFDNDDIVEIRFATLHFPLTRVVLTDARYAYVNPRGEIVDQWTQNERWEEWLYDLHHRLLLENAGLTLLGAAGLAMIVLVLAGVVAFWPQRRAFRYGPWPTSTARPQLLRAHRNLGAIIALPLMLTLVTGVLLAFPQPSETLLLEPFRGDDYSQDFGENLDEISGGGSGEWLPAMERAARSFPGAAIRSAQVPSAFSIYRVIGLKQPGELHPDGLSRVYIDADEGWMDVRIDSRAQHLSERLYNTVYPLHTGRQDHVVYRLLLTLSGLLVAALSTAGVVCFVRRQGSRLQ